MVLNSRAMFVGISVLGSFAGAVVILKEWMGGIRYAGKENIHGRTIIVTGANTGIGKETALELAKRGSTVVMACRNMKKCKEARKEIILETNNSNVICEECNLASLKSIRKFAQVIQNSYDRVDVLINNAGVMRCEKSVTEDGFETQFGTNHLGHFLLTILLLDKLKASTPSRVVNVSSIAHKKGKINFGDLNAEKSYDPGEAYNQSKLANILFTVELAERLKGTGVTSNAIHPGLVDTEIVRHMSFDKSWLAKIFLRPFIWLLLKTPAQGAQTTIYAAINEDLANVSGKYFSDQKETETSELGRDKLLANRLWLTSERWTGLS